MGTDPTSNLLRDGLLHVEELPMANDRTTADQIFRAGCLPLVFTAGQQVKNHQ